MTASWTSSRLVIPTACKSFRQVSIRSFQQITISASSQYYAVAVGDLNNDGNLDVVAAKNGASNGVEVWLGDGTMTTWTPWPSPTRRTNSSILPWAMSITTAGWTFWRAARTSGRRSGWAMARAAGRCRRPTCPRPARTSARNSATSITTAISIFWRRYRAAACKCGLRPKRLRPRSATFNPAAGSAPRRVPP